MLDMCDHVGRFMLICKELILSIFCVTCEVHRIAYLLQIDAVCGYDIAQQAVAVT